MAAVKPVETKALPGKILRQVWLRTFFLQASWNFERMQNMGICYALGPALRFYYRGETLTNAYRRHLEFFNTHPFMASPVIGTVLALEEAGWRGEKDVLNPGEFKRMVMAPYAAIGDALFWGGLRPVAAVVALFFAVRGTLWAPLVFLLLFNLPHLTFRTFGLLQGYAQSVQVVETLQRRRLPDLAIRLKEATVVLLGGLCAYLAFFTLRAEALPTGWGFVAAPAVLIAARLAHKGISILLQVLTAAVLLLALFRIF